MLIVIPESLLSTLSSLGRDRGQWFSYCILAFIIPFTSSISSNVFCCINTFSD